MLISKTIISSCNYNTSSSQPLLCQLRCATIPAQPQPSPQQRGSAVVATAATTAALPLCSGGGWRQHNLCVLQTACSFPAPPLSPSPVAAATAGGSTLRALRVSREEEEEGEEEEAAGVQEAGRPTVQHSPAQHAQQLQSCRFLSGGCWPVTVASPGKTKTRIF